MHPTHPGKLPQQLRGHLLLGRHLQPHLPVQLHAAAAVQCEEDQRFRRDGQVRAVFNPKPAVVEQFGHNLTVIISTCCRSNLLSVTLNGAEQC